MNKKEQKQYWYPYTMTSSKENSWNHTTNNKNWKDNVLQSMKIV